jgi:hypothetical protein
MIVWFVESWQDTEISDLLTPEVALTRVRVFFESQSDEAKAGDS